MPEEAERDIFNGHILRTPKTCTCRGTGQEGHCPTCDWGLSVCSVCGAAEVELDVPCTGNKPRNLFKD